jgi:hypothetical protein
LGAAIVDRLAWRSRRLLPGVRGWSPRNLRYMRALAETYATRDRAAVVAGLPWGHLTVLVSQVPEPAVRAWYVDQATRYRRSRSVLTHDIGTDPFPLIRFDRMPHGGKLAEPRTPAVTPNRCPRMLSLDEGGDRGTTAHTARHLGQDRDDSAGARRGRTVA